MLVFEFVCGGGWYRYPNFGSPVEASNESMLREGAAMLDAVVMRRLASMNTGAVVTVPVDSVLLSAIESNDSFLSIGVLNAKPLFQWIDDHRVNLIPVDSREKISRLFQKEPAKFDSAIVIAPEIENALFDFTKQFETIGVKLLSPNSEVVAIGSDKWLTYRHLVKYKIPTPETFLGFDSIRDLKGRYVVKPRFGAGSMDVKKIHSNDLIAGGVDSNWVIQPLVEGIPASIAVECEQKSGRKLMFPLMRQVFADDSFQYLSSEKINSQRLQLRAERLLNQVVATLPEFNGYLGIDIVLGTGSDLDYVIEINPRYTSSFCFV